MLLEGHSVPDIFIIYMGSLTGKAFQFYSCFISDLIKVDISNDSFISPPV